MNENDRLRGSYAHSSGLRRKLLRKQVSHADGGNEPKTYVLEIDDMSGVSQVQAS